MGKAATATFDASVRKRSGEIQTILERPAALRHDFAAADPDPMRSLMSSYRGLDDDRARARLLVELVAGFAPPEERIRHAMNGYARAAARLDRWHAATELREAVTSPLVEDLAQLNGVQGGLQFLLDLRADAIRFAGEHPQLAILDAELRILFARWFDRGFLRLQRISWDSSAALLEQLIRHEAVHAVRSWNDLRHRLESDRRCFALFHLCMPEEPLAFVEIALVESLVPSVGMLLDEAAPGADPRLARVAMFYSVSSTQPGLRGIGVGALLIERALESLRRELPQIRTFVTLSPAPSFRSWLQADAAAAAQVLSAEERRVLCALAQREGAHAALLEVLRTSDWHRRDETQAVLRPMLLRLAAHYFLAVKQAGEPRDPVARFHLQNGATLDRIHWLADTSERGLQQGAGMMVSYLYEPGRLRRNRQAYARARTVKAARAVKDFLCR